MTKNDIRIEIVKSLAPQVQLQELRVRERAYDLFLKRGERLGRDVEDWLEASREVGSTAPLTLYVLNGTYVVNLLVPGIDAKSVEITSAPDGLLVRADSPVYLPPRTDEIYVQEIEARPVTRTVAFPQAIDPTSLRAELQNGILRIMVAAASSIAVGKPA
jgi:HSP20 family molecular chaperone IbpA